MMAERKLSGKQKTEPGFAAIVTGNPVGSSLLPQRRNAGWSVSDSRCIQIETGMNSLEDSGLTSSSLLTKLRLSARNLPVRATCVCIKQLYELRSTTPGFTLLAGRAPPAALYMLNENKGQVLLNPSIMSDNYRLFTV